MAHLRKTFSLHWVTFSAQSMFHMLRRRLLVQGGDRDHEGPCRVVGFRL